MIDYLYSSPTLALLAFYIRTAFGDCTSSGWKKIPSTFFISLSVSAFMQKRRQMHPRQPGNQRCTINHHGQTAAARENYFHYPSWCRFSHFDCFVNLSLFVTPPVPARAHHADDDNFIKRCFFVLQRRSFPAKRACSVWQLQTFDYAFPF